MYLSGQAARNHRFQEPWMTFYEAAVEVLRSAGRPLHVKKITAVSVEQSLLTHVGRDPEKTMRERLAQEIAKAGDSIVRSVRPNIYALRDGVDPTEARQTVQPRKVDHLVDHIDDSLTQKDAPKAAQQRNGDASKKNQSNKNNKNQQRADSRGRGRDKDKEQDARNDKKRDDDRRSNQRRHDAQRRDDNKTANDNRSDKRDDNRRNGKASSTQDDNRTRRTQSANTRRASQSSGPRIAPSPAAIHIAKLRQQSDDEASAKAGDLAAHIHDILKDAPKGLLLKEIGSKLADTAYATLPQLPLQALRSTLTRANQLRAEKGQPPLFTASTDGRWSLIEEDEALSESLDILENWQKRHKTLLARRLEHVIAERSNEQLLGIVALVMERLGYEDVKLHPAEGEEIATFSGTLAHGLSESCVAVRVFPLERPITRLDVMAFRGNLHQYDAERGAIFTLGGHSLCARQQINAPNAAPVTLLQDSNLAELMMRTHVGTAEVKVSVPDLDHAFFA